MTTKQNSAVLRFKKINFHKLFGFAKLQYNPRFTFTNETPIVTDEIGDIHPMCD